MTSSRCFNACGNRRFIMKTLTSSLLGTLAVGLGIAMPSAALAQTHVDNPFVGATVYKNPDYAAKVQTSIDQTTLSVLARGALEGEYGVPWREIVWVAATAEPMPFDLPAGARLERI